MMKLTTSLHGHREIFLKIQFPLPSCYIPGRSVCKRESFQIVHAAKEQSKSQNDVDAARGNGYAVHGSFLELFGVGDGENSNFELGESLAPNEKQEAANSGVLAIQDTSESTSAGDDLLAVANTLEDDWDSMPESEWKTNESISSQKSVDTEDVNKRFKLRNGREVFQERAYLMGINRKNEQNPLFRIEESLEELEQLADTAGMVVVGSAHQTLDHPNPKTYIGPGKLEELKSTVLAFGVETVVFDDELSPAQLRNLEKFFGDEVRVCDRTALILDIFSQRAATKEATLQVELAQTEYQLPRLTRMWSHLERQAGGLVKGMGEKQIEVDKRILRNRISSLKSSLSNVSSHRKLYRRRRQETNIPVASMVGYTNAGKSTLLNRLTNAAVFAEDKLFATLDPTTRKLHLPGGKDILVSDTVGFIQKLPTQLVAAFRATLEEIQDASLLIHVVDISHPMVEQQTKTVDSVLDELEVQNIPVLTVWNKIDRASNPRALMKLADSRKAKTVCVSALKGYGMEEFFSALEDSIKEMMVSMEAVIPYSEGDLLNLVHRLGIVSHEEFVEEGTVVCARVPVAIASQLRRFSVPVEDSGLDLVAVPGEERIIEIDF